MNKCETNILYGNDKRKYFFTAIEDNNNTTDSETTHARAEPTLFRSATNTILKTKQTIAPHIAQSATKQSFLIGIRSCIMKICSVPIIKTRKITILIGRTAD
jgi:hypothetical protein